MAILMKKEREVIDLKKCSLGKALLWAAGMLTLIGAVWGIGMLCMRYMKKQRLARCTKGAMQVVGNMLLQIAGQ